MLSCDCKGVTMGLRPTKAKEDAAALSRGINNLPCVLNGALPRQQ